ncbi:3'(2'),5'-bisphosphate nucleotidase CysQ [Sinomicrobium sp. M5D2P9]
MKPDQLLEVAIKASLDAGEKIMEIYDSGDFDVDYKSDNSPLTTADVSAHHIIMEYLDKTGIPVLSEEGRQLPYEERKKWEKLWIVDPIDGTREFIKKNGEFTVNIALIHQQAPVLGVIYVPASRALYFSGKKIGSFKCEDISLENGTWKKQISDAVKLPAKRNKKAYTVVASRSHLSPETKDFIDALKEKYGEVETISKGSSLKLCMVAEGEADCYPRFAPTMEWDTAAGQAICEHAGFKVIDYTTKEEMKYNRENLLNNWFLVQ